MAWKTARTERGEISEIQLRERMRMGDKTACQKRWEGRSIKHVESLLITAMLVVRVPRVKCPSFAIPSSLNIF